MAVYLGIDPGKSGGLALLSCGGDIIFTQKMPETDRDVFEALNLHRYTSICEVGVRAVLERVRSSPQMGVVSAFTFGRGYGGLRMALAGNNIPFDEVTPQQWQRVMQCRTGGDKNITKARAQELWPNHHKITHAIADALLLAEYCRRCYERIV